MAKTQKSYVCQSCGSVFAKWAGRCEACGEWNCIHEEVTEAAPKGLADSKAKGRIIEFLPLRGESEPLPRKTMQMGELDRVLGGGLVAGSVILLGGDPGIGKSTLLLQAVCQMAIKGAECLYISGEEAVDQVRLRAVRLGLDNAKISLAAATSVRDIVVSIEKAERVPDLVIIDSIQTMYVDTIDSAPGTVTQVRTATSELIRLAKKRNIAIVLVGHVTKEGMIAGPRVLEHMVDTVLYFEGDRGHQFRILRAVKNRFGPTDEIGVFEMAGKGLVEVPNPSEIFLSDRQDNAPGTAILAGMEGSRPVLVEVQALAAPTSFATPRRAVVGWDTNRLAMMTAVFEARYGITLSMNDIYLNIAGGLRITETAVDLAVAAALISSLNNEAIGKDTVFFGEVGLAGEIRSVAHADQRLKEAAKLGFKHAIVPKTKGKNTLPDIVDGMTVIKMADLNDLITMLGRPKRKERSQKNAEEFFG